MADRDECRIARHTGPVPLWDEDDDGVPLWQLLNDLGDDATEEARQAVMTEVVTGRRARCVDGDWPSR